MTAPKLTTRIVDVDKALRLMGHDPDAPGAIRENVLIDMGGPRPLRRLATYRRRDRLLRATCADIAEGVAYFADKQFVHVIFKPLPERVGTRPNKNPMKSKKKETSS